MSRWTVSAPKEWQYVEVDGIGFVVGTFDGEVEDLRGRISVIPAVDCVQMSTEDGADPVWLDASAFSPQLIAAINEALEADWRADALNERAEARVPT